MHLQLFLFNRSELSQSLEMRLKKWLGHNVKEKLAAQGYQSAPTTPLEHDKILREQIKDFGEIARRLGLKPQ